MRERNHVLVLRDGRKFEVGYNEADVSFPIVSIGEASQHGNWFVFGPGCQAMLPGSSGQFLKTCVKDPNAAKLEKTPRSVLVAMFGDGTHGRSTVVPKSQSGKVSCCEAPPISVLDPDPTPMQLEESEETRSPNT